MSTTRNNSGRPADGHDIFHAKGPQQDEDGNSILVSLCLIVKNEETRLPTLLDSVAPWVDELVVVDTGSEDATVTVAEGYGARIFHHPWRDSFSLARNQSLSYARGQWILIMDADEELEQASGPRLKTTLESMPDEVGVIFFKLYNHLPSNQGSWALQPRIFRNVKGFCYRGSVHNEAVLPGKPFKSELTVIHYGYDLDPETMAVKHERRLRMIKGWIEREPDTLAPHAYLAQTLLSETTEQSRLEAVEESRIALRLAEAKGHPEVDLPRCYYPLIVSLHRLGRDEETEKYSLECAGKVPYYPDPYHFLSFLAMKRGDMKNTLLWSRRFMETQDWAEANPETFRYIEILTVAQKGQNLYRWSLSAAILGKKEESLAAFERLVTEVGEERWVRHTLQDFLSNNLVEMAEQATETALSAHPEWQWLGYYREVALAGVRGKEARELRLEAGKALERGDRGQALEIMRKVLELTPEDGAGLVSAAELVPDKDPDQALVWLMKGLSARVGGAGHWNDLGDILFQKGNYRGADAAYRRCLAMDQSHAKAQARLKTLARRLKEQEYIPLPQKPPRMVVFLASGLSREMVGQAAPEFLMGKAWGGLVNDKGDGLIRNLTHWATLFTARGPEEHGLLDRKDQPFTGGLKDLPLVTLWELIGREQSLGLMSVPLCTPPLGLNGWCAAGPPHGLLEPGLVEPDTLAPLLLAGGFRPDFLVNQFEEHVFAHKLVESRSYEAGCYAAERAKFRATLEMPPVDVLVLGYHFLDRMHIHLNWEGDRIFGAYQQFYGWVDAALAVLKPADFVILGQRGYSKGSKQPDGQALYCLSWLSGENGTAEPVEVAPRILERLGLDAAGLGAKR